MKQHKFNWVDALVLLVVLALVAGTVVKFLVLDPNKRQQAQVPITFQVEVKGVREATRDAIQVGDGLYDNEGKGQVGTITAIDSAPAETWATFPDGTTRLVPSENRYDLTLTLTANAVQEGQVYKVGAYAINANQSTIYFTKYSIWSGRIISVQEADA